MRLDVVDCIVCINADLRTDLNVEAVRNQFQKVTSVFYDIAQLVHTVHQVKQIKRWARHFNYVCSIVNGETIFGLHFEKSFDLLESSISVWLYQRNAGKIFKNSWKHQHTGDVR